MTSRAAIGVLLLGLMGPAVAALAQEGVTSQPAGDRLLKAELRMLRATVKKQRDQIEKLRQEIAKLKQAIQRLRQVCKAAGIDPKDPAAVATPAEKKPKPFKADRSQYRSVAELLRAVPKQLMPPGKATPDHRAELVKWANRELPGKALAADITIRSLQRLPSGAAQIAGELPSPARLHRRQAHCIVYARFSSEDAKQLLNLKKGTRIKVTGVLPRGRQGSRAPLRAGSGAIDLELYGHRVGTKERVQGWNEKHAFIEIRLEKCRIVK